MTETETIEAEGWTAETLPGLLQADPLMRGDTFDPGTVEWVRSPRDLPALFNDLQIADYVVLDLETTGLDEWAPDAEIVMAAFTLGNRAPGKQGQQKTWVLPLSHPESPLAGLWRSAVKFTCQTLRDANALLVGHNLKFDLRWLHAHNGGIDLSSHYSSDTQVTAHLLDETASTALKNAAPRLFRIDAWNDFDLSQPGAAKRVPLFQLGEYGARDTYWTWRLHRAHRHLMAADLTPEEIGALDPVDVEGYRLGRLADSLVMPSVAAITLMEQTGFEIDLSWIGDQIETNEAIVSERTADLVDRYGVIEGQKPSFAPTSLWFREWAERAVDAGDLQVAQMTPSGKPKWDRTVLRRQAASGSQVAGSLLDLRGSAKLLEFLRSWQGKAAATSRIHATYRVGGAVSGRLSSSDPNMQQVTRALKPAFVPRPGHLIAELDYSQIELRIAADLAGCLPMLEAFCEGQDLHAMLAGDITGQAPENVSGEDRQRAKAANFGFLYGQEAAGFLNLAETAYGVYLSLQEAEVFRSAFFTRWDGLEDWHSRMIREAHREGQVVSPLGRVRRLPDIYSSNPIDQAEAERRAINSPVQGMASDLMQLAIAWISGALPGRPPVPDVRCLATVHDSVVVEVPADNWQVATGRAMRRMIDVDQVVSELFGYTLHVPLAVEAKVGTRWGLADVGVIT